MRWMPILAVAAAASLAAGCTQEPVDWESHTQGLPFVIGYEEGLAAAREQDKPAMFFVTQSYCGPCKKLARENFNEPEVKELLDNFVLVLVDAASEQETALALGAGSTPHLVFTTSRGKPVGHIIGYKPPEKFRPTLENALEVVRREEGGSTETQEPPSDEAKEAADTE